MPEKPNTNVTESFEEFLKAAPEAPDTDRLNVSGIVMRGKTKGSFLLQTEDAAIHEVPQTAVSAFQALEAGAGIKAATLTLNRSALTDSLKQALDKLIAVPPKRPPFDTLKEPVRDTLKEQPFDTLKELGQDKSIASDPKHYKEVAKEQLKEAVKEAVKEMVKDPILDPPKFIKEALKEIPKEVAFDPPENPGDIFVNPAVNAGLRAAQPQVQSATQATAANIQHATLKPAFDTIKEVSHDATLKEIIRDPKYVKEIVKDAPFEGTGIADSLYEHITDPRELYTNPLLNAAAIGGVPFVLATPHQASQGAVAQQLLAAQALTGRLGY